MTPLHLAQEQRPSTPDDRSVSLSARLLGPVQLTVDGRGLASGVWSRRAARSLLLLLLTTPGHRIERERAVDLLWPELPPDRARNIWYQTLSTLRRILEPSLRRRQESAFVTTDAATIALVDDLALWVDVDAFEAALRRARDGAPTERRVALCSALALYSGDFLAEEPATDWAAGRREELHVARQAAVLELADLDLQAGEPLASVAALRAVLAANGAAEKVHRALDRAFAVASNGNQAGYGRERSRPPLVGGRISASSHDSNRLEITKRANGVHSPRRSQVRRGA
jgi:DNA-binding SARP family transcriptional activator